MYIYTLEWKVAMQDFMNKRVMLIDDSITIRMSVSKFLSTEVHEVILAEGGFDALAKITEVKPDIIFLDLSMPNWSGFQVLSLLKTHENYKNIPVVILSGKDGISDRAKALLLGASDFLLKPCTKEAITKVLQQCS